MYNMKCKSINNPNSVIEMMMMRYNYKLNLLNFYGEGVPIQPDLLFHICSSCIIDYRMKFCFNFIKIYFIL